MEVCSAIILLYRDHGSREARNKKQVGFSHRRLGRGKNLGKPWKKRLGKSLSSGGVDLRENEKSEHIGIYRQKQPLMNYVGLKIPVGRIHSNKLDGMARLAEKYGNGEVRFSHSNSLVIPYVSDDKLGDMLEEDLVKEFTYHPSSIMRGLVSCVGSDYCNLAAIEN